MTTYTQLVQSIQDSMEDRSAEFAANIPSFIVRTSERLYRDVDSYSFVTATSVAMQPGDPMLALPEGEFIIKNISFRRDGECHVLQQKTDEYLREYWPVHTSTGQPKYYSRIRDGFIYLAPTPDASYETEFTYMAVPATISASMPTNAFTERMGNALFNGCMYEANRFDKAWEAAQFWDMEYQKEVQRITNESRRRSRDDNRDSSMGNPVVKKP